MSLFEWVGDLLRPKRTGRVEIGESKSTGSPLVVSLCFLVSLAILGAIFVYLPFDGLLLFGITMAYLLIAYFVLPEPDYGNMGWFGGLMDNPFRISDDLNRFLFFLRVLLIPGRFMARSIVNFFVMLSRIGG